ncbi:hypothetical protein [Scytonema millei]|uniref:Uncharacterized protein n=1 Tax=Scytonema millei VB511283 TaxID=1245923 RepID=A0A9X5E5C7_9CYAN|nr:hypothetical protein [Scytonema millei]NHC34302.1 hypothetical protein [Scytonema millei VB511283]
MLLLLLLAAEAMPHPISPATAIPLPVRIEAKSLLSLSEQGGGKLPAESRGVAGLLHLAVLTLIPRLFC